jgi:galactonate dehydratase
VGGTLPSGRVAPVAGSAVEMPGPIRIRRIRCYIPPRPRPLLSQSNAIVTVETDQGITGIGEGGSEDTVKSLAGLLIGEDAARIEHLWQLMYRGHFYPPGREKLHALGALDVALWDIRGKALGRPLFELFGGLTRDHVECYSTAFPSRGTLRETARACIEAGFRAFRIGVADPERGQPFDASAMVRKSYEECREVREGVGPGGEWAIDYHTRLDQADAVRLSTLIEDLEPFFAEDLVRSEDTGVYRTLRQQVKVPIAVGEQFGDRWDINELVEQHLVDYSRVTIPNVGGLTEFRKLASLCELHYVGLLPHFTGSGGDRGPRPRPGQRACARGHGDPGRGPGAGAAPAAAFRLSRWEGLAELAARVGSRVRARSCRPRRRGVRAGEADPHLSAAGWIAHKLVGASPGPDVA